MKFTKRFGARKFHFAAVAFIVALTAFWYSKEEPENEKTNLKEKLPVTKIIKSMRGTPITYPAPNFLLPPLPEKIKKIVEVRAGDTFLMLLKKLGVPNSSAHKAIRAMGKIYPPKSLKRGQKVVVIFQPNSWWETNRHFAGFNFSPTSFQIISVSRKINGTFEAKRIKEILESRDFGAKGIIHANLFLAATKAGLTPSTLFKLVRLYSWDVDFQRDIQKGDSFTVFVERLHHKNGQIAKWGEIRYAKLVLSGKALQLYQFRSNRHGIEYFDEHGASAQKALMKTPINGARLSSGYGRRRHPILGYNKMHRGVDFAAPSGTPVFAAGNGKVIQAARQANYGKLIKIRHNKSYTTVYAHLRGFKRGIRRGKRINQGEIIGYVGSTGRSTGPHLHYEVHAFGKRVNPMRLKLPSGRKLKGRELSLFKENISKLDKRMKKLFKDK